MPISLLAYMIEMSTVLSVIALRTVVGIDHPVLIHRQIGHGRLAGTFKRSATVQHRLVLGDAGDDVVALFAVKLDHALDCQIVGLGRAAGENDFLGLGVDQRGDLVARALSTASSASQPKLWLRLAALPNFSREIRQHRLEHPLDRPGSSRDCPCKSASFTIALSLRYRESLVSEIN